MVRSPSRTSIRILQQPFPRSRWIVAVLSFERQLNGCRKRELDNSTVAPGKLIRGNEGGGSSWTRSAPCVTRGAGVEAAEERPGISIRLEQGSSWSTKNDWALRGIAPEMANSIVVRTSGGAGPKEYKPIQCFNEILKRPASLECHIARVEWLLIAEPEGLSTDLNRQVFSPTISQYVLASRGREESSGTFHPATFANTYQVIGGR